MMRTLRRTLGVALVLAVVLVCLRSLVIQPAQGFGFILGLVVWCYVCWRAWPAIRQDFSRSPRPRFRRIDEENSL